MTGWHLDKRVNVGHLLTTLLMALGLVTWAIKMEARIERVEVLAHTVQDSERRMEQRIVDQLDKTDERMVRIENKIDRLVERGLC